MCYKNVKLREIIHFLSAVPIVGENNLTSEAGETIRFLGVTTECLELPVFSTQSLLLIITRRLTGLSDRLPRTSISNSRGFFFEFCRLKLGRILSNDVSLDLGLRQLLFDSFRLLTI